MVIPPARIIKTYKNPKMFNNPAPRRLWPYLYLQRELMVHPEPYNNPPRTNIEKID